VLTTVPMHPGDIARSLLKKIIKDVGLTEEEFRKLL
jgi:predicted RNA binding protein YcfA (HicA-like mRNA interferase family)